VKMFTRILMVLLALGSFSVQAQAFRWVDKDGKVRYGDIPPPGVKAVPMKSASSVPAPVAAPAAKDAKPPADPGQAFNERQIKAREETAKLEKEQVDAEVRRKHCARSQGYLRSLEQGHRISTTTAQGERAFLDDTQRQAQMDETKAEIAKNCR